MAETKQQEHERLQERTEALKQEHAHLGLDRTPFDQDDHDAHIEKLREHQQDLAAHKLRP